MIQLLICENDREKMDCLRGRLGEVSIREHIELEVYWLHGENMEEEIPKYIHTAQAVLISMCISGSQELCREVRKQNSQCRLLIYGAGQERLPGWIPGGPVAYCPEMTAVKGELVRLVREIEAEQYIFHFQSRKESIHIPYGSILYLQSDRRTVKVVCRGGKEYSFLSRLDEVEEKIASASFIRIHKSFLVNRMAVRALNHTERQVELENGEMLPVSSRYYAEAEEKFKA